MDSIYENHTKNIPDIKVINEFRTSMEEGRSMRISVRNLKDLLNFASVESAYGKAYRMFSNRQALLLYRYGSRFDWVYLINPQTLFNQKSEKRLNFLLNWPKDEEEEILGRKDELKRKALSYLERMRLNGNIPNYNPEEEGQFKIISGKIPFPDETTLTNDWEGYRKNLGKIYHGRFIDVLIKAVQMDTFYSASDKGKNPGDEKSGWIERV